MKTSSVINFLSIFLFFMSSHLCAVLSEQDQYNIKNFATTLHKTHGIDTKDFVERIRDFVLEKQFTENKMTVDEIIFKYATGFLELIGEQNVDEAMIKELVQETFENEQVRRHTSLRSFFTTKNMTIVIFAIVVIVFLFLIPGVAGADLEENGPPLPLTQQIKNALAPIGQGVKEEFLKVWGTRNLPYVDSATREQFLREAADPNYFRDNFGVDLTEKTKEVLIKMAKGLAADGIHMPYDNNYFGRLNADALIHME